MNSLNQVILEGNVVRQPESRDCRNGSKVCYIPIAVNRYYKDAGGEKIDEVSYFDITAFGNLADNCMQWCPKGRGIRVVGRLKQNVQEKDGKKQSYVSIIAEHIEFKPMKRVENSMPKEMLSEAAEAAKKEEMEF